MPSFAPSFTARPTFSCSTTCASLVLLLLEVASAIVLFVLGHLSAVRSGALYVSGTLGALAILCGILGLMRSTPALVASLMVAISTTFEFVLLGGLSVIFSLNIDSPMATYLDRALVPVSAVEKTKLVHDAKRCLSIAAALLLTSAAVHALFARHLFAVVGARRGAVAFLQIFALVTLPFALFLVVGGQYIVDTGTLASAPYTGIIVFAVGTAMLIIALLTFIGGTFEYRRLLSICCLLSFVSGTAVVGIAIAYFAMRTNIQANLLAHWETIRDVLPPTYQARYDRDQFGHFMTTNLQMAAFVGIIVGLFLMLEASVCLTLMRHATLVKRQLAQDKETIKQADGGAAAAGRSRVDPAGHAQAHLRRQWTLHFEPSKRRQRVAMRLAALVFVLGVAFIFSVLCANVVFVTKCNSIGKLVQTVTVPVVENASEASVEAIRIINRFTRGTVTIAPTDTNATAGHLQLNVYGNEVRSALDPTLM